MVEEVEAGEGSSRGVPVGGRLAGELPEVRRSAEQHVLRDGHPRRRDRLLRHDGDGTRPVTTTEHCRLNVVQRDRPVVREEARQGSQQRRLARSVRPDQPHPLALGDLEVDVAHHGPPSEPDRDAARRDRAHARPRIVRSAIAKNGAPKNAVTTPIGSSAGDSTVRAMTSQSTRKPAPTMNDSGRRPR